MSAVPDGPPRAAGLPSWIPQLTRGIAAIVLGIVITLTLDHSSGFGLLVFGVFGVLSGATLLVGTVRGPLRGRVRVAFLVQGAVTLIAGIAALVLPPPGIEAPMLPGVGIASLAALVAGWALVSGLLELLSGIVSRRSLPAARDWIVVGALTLILGIVFLLVPHDLAQSVAGENGSSGTLTSSIILVGVLGAWAIVSGVLQVISAVTLRTDAVRGPTIRAEAP